MPWLYWGIGSRSYPMLDYYFDGESPKFRHYGDTLDDLYLKAELPVPKEVWWDFFYYALMMILCDIITGHRKGHRRGVQEQSCGHPWKNSHRKVHSGAPWFTSPPDARQVVSDNYTFTINNQLLPSWPSGQPTPVFRKLVRQSALVDDHVVVKVRSYIITTITHRPA